MKHSKQILEAATSYMSVEELQTFWTNQILKSKDCGKLYENDTFYIWSDKLKRSFEMYICQYILENENQEDIKPDYYGCVTEEHYTDAYNEAVKAFDFLEVAEMHADAHLHKFKETTNENY